MFVAKFLKAEPHGPSAGVRAELQVVVDHFPRDVRILDVKFVSLRAGASAMLSFGKLSGHVPSFDLLRARIGLG